MKMRKFIFLPLAFGFFVDLAIAQKIVERTVGDFSKIRANAPVSVILQKGTHNQVKIEFENLKEDDILTEVSNQTLKISLRRAEMLDYRNHKITCTVTYTAEPSEITLSGACSLKATDKIKTSNFTLEASGASNVSLGLEAEKANVVLNGASNASLDVESENLRIEASGASSIKIDGKTNQLTAEINGASSFKALDLVSEHCKVEVSGASNMQVHATQSIEANVSGASSLKYKGNPQSRNIETSGMSSVKIVN